jgi:hypothetical protein
MTVTERLDHWLTRSSPPWKAGLMVAASFMVGGGLLVVVLPEVVAAVLPGLARYSAAERTDWIDSVRTGLLGVLAFGTVAAWVTQYRQSVLARTVDEYTEGVRQLSQSTWEQAAAIRDLEGIAVSNPELRVKTLQMLAVFVRQMAPRTDALRDASTKQPDNRGPGSWPRSRTPPRRTWPTRVRTRRVTTPPKVLPPPVVLVFPASRTTSAWRTSTSTEHS